MQGPLSVSFWNLEPAKFLWYFCPPPLKLTQELLLGCFKIRWCELEASVLTCLFNVKQEAWKTGEKSLLLHSKCFDQLTSWLVHFLHSGKEEKEKWRGGRNTRKTPEGPKSRQPGGGGGAVLWPHRSVLHQGLCFWGLSGGLAAIAIEHLTNGLDSH